MITLELPYPISANRYWASRVVTPKDKRPMAMTYVTPEAKQFKERVGWMAKAAGVRAPLQGRVAIAYTLHPHRPLDWERRQRKDPTGWEDTVQCIDLDNANKVLLDALKGVVFEDDRWVRTLCCYRGEPRAEASMVVHIKALVPVSPQMNLEVA